MPTARIGNSSFNVELRGTEVWLNGAPLQWDIQRIGNGHYHILHLGKSFTAEVLSVNRPTKTVRLKINNVTVEVELKDKLDELLEKMGIQSATQNKDALIKAPMPGLILDIRVKAGDAVQAGDALLILEAMKMENVMKAPAAGTIKAVHIKQRDNVEKGQLLIEMHS